MNSLVISRLGLIANVVTVIAAVVTGYIWMESRFRETLNTRIEPYEQLLQGLSLSQYGNSEKAIEVLSRAFARLSEQEVSEATLASVIDPYLSALADSDNPAEHWPDFQNILPFVETRLPLTGERLMNVAWIYLYTGHRDQAEEKFRHSIKVYGGDQDSTESAESHWGLSLALLAKGDVVSALSEYLIATEKNPFEHDVEDTLKGKAWFIQQWWVAQLQEIYSPEFLPAVEKFYVALQQVQQRDKDARNVPEPDS